MFAYFPRFARFGLALVGSLLLTGCANYIFKTFDLDGRNESLSVDAKQRLVFVTEKGGKTRDRKIVCAEPSPDALSATAASGSASAAITFPTLIPGAGQSGGTGQGTTSAGGGLAGASSETVASLAMRTQTIQLLRDGYYRLCEAYMNGAIDQHQYNVVLVNIDKLMITLMGVDGIAGTRVVSPVTISAVAPPVKTSAGPAPAGQNQQGAGGGAGEVLPTTVPAANIENVIVPAPGAVQAEAIANIILAANSHTSYPGLCVSLLASGELRLDNPGQFSVLKSCDYLLNGVAGKFVAHRGHIHPTPTNYKVSNNAANAQNPTAKK